MNRIYINKINRDFNLELCKVNKSVLCDIPLTALESISRSINDIDFISVVNAINMHYINKRRATV